MSENFQITIVVLAGSLIFIILVVFILFSIIQFNRAKAIHELEKENMSQEFSNELIQSELSTKKNMLGLISDEIHDNIGQILSFIKLDVHSLKSDHPQAKTERILNSLDSAISGLREISHQISSNSIEKESLESLIQKRVDDLNASAQFKSELRCNVNLDELSPDKKLVIYRFIQEVMNNTVKHAEPNLFEIECFNKGEYLIIRCQDDGKGFNLNDKRKSNGMLNLKKRAESIDAELTIITNLGEGTSIILQI